MFGLMKVSTHEAAMLRVKQNLNAVKAERNELLIQKTRKFTAEAEIVTLKARIAEMEKPLPLPKRRPVAKASFVTETAKVSAKAKV